MNWIDTHTHFGMLEETPEDALKLAQNNGVYRFINIGTCTQDHEKVLELAEKHYPIITCTLGVHPHDAHSYSDTIDSYLRKKALQKEVIAIGEIGLDYHYMNSTKEQQILAFKKQLEIAKDLHLPVQIHTRDADEDTLKILSQFKGKVTGLLHCFTGSKWLAEEAINLGFHFSISGVVTFKKAQDLQEIVKNIPIDRLHIETDAPFLAPIPFRGKKNTPAYVKHTGEFVAQLKNVSPQFLAEQILENTKKLFPKFQG